MLVAIWQPSDTLGISDRGDGGEDGVADAVGGVGDGEGAGGLGHAAVAGEVGEDFGGELGEFLGVEVLFLDEGGGVDVGEDFGVAGLVVVGGVGVGDEDGWECGEGDFR